MGDDAFSHDMLQPLIQRWYDAAEQKMPVEAKEYSQLYGDTQKASQFLHTIKDPTEFDTVCKAIIEEFDRHGIGETELLAKWMSDHTIKKPPESDGGEEFHGMYRPLNHLFQTVLEEKKLSSLPVDHIVSGEFASLLHLDSAVVRYMEMTPPGEVTKQKEMLQLALDIETNKKRVPNLSDEEWAIFGPHLHYVDISDIQNPATVELILKSCPHITQLKINNTSITELPPLPYCKRLDCSDCTSLENLPALPACIFLDCSDCTSLENLPALPACTSLCCRNCSRLTNLPALPACIFLDCTGCSRLTNLLALPVCTYLYCGNCSGLTNLPALPACTSLNCSRCFYLEKLPDLPACTSLNCSYCDSLEKLPDLPECTHLDCTKCTSLKKLPALPACTTLDCSDCTSLKKLPALPACTTLHCSRSGLTKLPALPACTSLNCSYCDSLEKLPALPVCTELRCRVCYLTELPALPACIFLDCSNCDYLNKLPALPACIFLDCSNCDYLNKLPDLPVCTSLDCSNCTSLENLPALPACTSLNCSNCTSLENLPALPVCTYLNCAECLNLQNLPELPGTATVISTHTPYGGFRKLDVNQEDFATNPKKILLNLGDNYLLKGLPFPNVYYFYEGEPSPAIDVGGVRRDLVSRLSENLFKGKGEEFLSLEEDGMPALGDGPDEVNSYRTIGKILALCCVKESEFKTGPLFSEKVYEMLVTLPTEGLYGTANEGQDALNTWFLTNYLTEREVPEAVYKVVDLNEELPEISDDDLNVLNYLNEEGLGTELSKDSFDDPTNREAFRNGLLEEALKSKSSQAVLKIGESMAESLGKDAWQVLMSGDVQALMDQVQGTLNAEDLLKKLEWKKMNSVTNGDFEKTQAYLTNWIENADIENADNESLRSFVRAVTSNNTLNSKNIKVEVFSRGEDNIPVTHTCFYTLELSGDYPSQEHFNEKLNLLLTEGLAGGGFQVA